MFGADDQVGRLAQFGFAVRQMSTAHGKVFFFHLSLF
jgi:hypothetical protein